MNVKNVFKAVLFIAHILNLCSSSFAQNNLKKMIDDHGDGGAGSGRYSYRLKVQCGKNKRDKPFWCDITTAINLASLESYEFQMWAQITPHCIERSLTGVLFKLGVQVNQGGDTIKCDYPTAGNVQIYHLWKLRADNCKEMRYNKLIELYGSDEGRTTAVSCYEIKRECDKIHQALKTAEDTFQYYFEAREQIGDNNFVTLEGKSKGLITTEEFTKIIAPYATPLLIDGTGGSHYATAKSFVQPAGENGTTTLFDTIWLSCFMLTFLQFVQAILSS